MEPDIIEKIRVRQIEVMDDNENVVMSVGAKHGIYHKNKNRDLVVLLDNDNNETVVLGTNINTGYIKVMGSDGSVNIETDASGGEICINRSEGNRIMIYPTNNGVKLVFNNGLFYGDSVAFEIDLSTGEVKISSRLDKVETTKLVFKSGK